MFFPILVPLDGSQLAECVLPHVEAIAGSLDAEITLLRILEKKQAGTSAQLFDLLNWQINKTRSILYLDIIKARLEASGHKPNTLVLEGLEAEGITEFAQDQGIKLIVLSNHGRNGLTRWGISNITQKIILSAPTSLLIVRANQPTTNSGQSAKSMVYKRILIPLDGSQRAENVLPILTELAHFHHSQLHLVHVVQSPEMARQLPPTQEDIELSKRVVARNHEEASNYLNQLKTRSALDGIDVQTRLIVSDNAAYTLHQLAEQEQFDLVALSAHGYSGMQSWPYGSMVNNFINYCTRSLLIVQDLPAKDGQLSNTSSALERAER